MLSAEIQDAISRVQRVDAGEDRLLVYPTTLESLHERAIVAMVSYKADVKLLADAFIAEHAQEVVTNAG